MLRKILSRWMVLGGFAIFIFVVLVTKEREVVVDVDGFVNRNLSCYDEPTDRHGVERFNEDEEMLANGMNIFFHETSCFTSDESVINSRQACAVESAAKMNPNMTVYLLILSPSRLSNSSRELVRQLLKYKNIRIRRVLINDYIRNTPLEQWYASGVLKTSNWPASHMSDILRYLTLWKFGGIYLDLDVVVTTVLENMTNFVGAESPVHVAAGVIALSGTGFGRTVANECLRDLQKNFRGNLWGNNGPGVITRTLQKICGVTYAKDMTPEKCKGFTVFPPSAFYPIYYEQWKQYFETKNADNTMRIIEKARAIHVWNRFSKTENIRVGSKVPYALVAEKFCPNVYNNCGTTF